MRDGLRRISPILSLGLLGLLGCGRVAASPAVPGAPTVTRGAFAPKILLTGELVAEKAVRFVTPNANIWPVQIQWIEEDGVEVAAGDPVVEFDNSRLSSNLEELRNSVRSAEDALASTRAEVASRQEEAGFDVADAKARLAKARLDADVPAELFSARDYEQRQLELHRAELEATEARRKQASAQQAGSADIELKRVVLEKARLAVELNERRLAVLSLHAPRAGVVLRHENPQQRGRPFKSGDNTWPGKVVASLPDLATLMVEASLYDVDDGRIEIGQDVRATLDAYPDRVFRGRVRSVDRLAKRPTADATRRVFRVRVDLEEIDEERMRPGMSVKLEVAGPVRRDVLLVPRAAIDFSAGSTRVVLATGQPA